MVFYLLFLFTLHEKAGLMKAESVAVLFSIDLYLWPSSLLDHSSALGSCLWEKKEDKREEGRKRKT